MPAARDPSRRLLLVLALLTGFGPLSIDMYLPGLPEVGTDLGATASATQLTLSASLVGLALGQVLAGPVSDALGRRRPLLVGTAVYAAVSVLCAIAPSVEVLAALRLLQGLAGAAGIVIARAVVRDRYSGTAAARTYGALAVVSGLAPILAPLVGAQVLRLGDWRTVFVVLAGLGIVAGLAVRAWVAESLPPGRRRPGGLVATRQGFGVLARDRRFVGHAVASGLAMAAMFVYISGSPFVLQRIHGLSEGLYSVVFAGNGLGIVLASVLGTRLVERLGPDAIFAAGLRVGLTGGVLVLVSVLTGAGLPLLLPGFFLVVSSIGLVLPAGTGLALEDHPQVAGAASALLGGLQFGLGGLCAPLAGIAGKDTAVPTAVAIVVLGTLAFGVHRVLVRGRAAPSDGAAAPHAGE